MFGLLRGNSAPRRLVRIEMSLAEHRNLVPYMEGCLAKRLKPKFCNWWRNFWFLLNGKTMYCFKNRHESDVQQKLPRKEFLNFAKVHAVRPIHDSSKRFSFEIVTRKSTIILAASTDEMRRKWIDTLQSALLLSIISSPIIEKKSSELRKSQFFGNKEYSLSQPDLSKRIRVVQDFPLVPRIRRASLKSTYKSVSSYSDDPFHTSDAPDRPWKARPNRETVLTPAALDPANHRCLQPSSTDRLAGLRCTAAEFFTSEQNVNWPSLSMDIQDEILQEIVHKHEQMRKRDSQTSKSGGGHAAVDSAAAAVVVVKSLSEIGTQTEFSDDCDECCESDDDDDGGSEIFDCPCDCYEDSSS